MKSRTADKGKKPASARQLALDVLVRVEQDQSYSNLLLHQALSRSELNKPDAALATELVYGTIQRLGTIDYFLARFVKGGLAKLEPWVRSLLRLSFYQLYYLQRIPDHAAVNEAVDIAKRKGHQGISGMVNGVLRNVIRQKADLVVPDSLEPAVRIAIRHSHPEWLVRRWIAQYGEELTERICEANNTPPHVSIRVNLMRRTRDELLAELRREGVQAEPSPLAPAGIVVEHAGNMALHPLFRSGEFSIQDESSMLVAEFVDPKPGMAVLDCCAAPGGKTAHLAEKMEDTGSIVASDIHEHKKKLIDEQAGRLGLTCIRTLVADANELADRFPPASFDRVLLDAPCSGFGVIRRKPEIKWTKRERDIADIAAVQKEILHRVCRLVKPGGVLVYSTCTIERSENDEMIRAFLQDHPEFALERDDVPALPVSANTPPARNAPDAGAAPEIASAPKAAPTPPVTAVTMAEAYRSEPGMVQIFPHEFGTDGFFIAKLRRLQNGSFSS